MYFIYNSPLSRSDSVVPVYTLCRIYLPDINIWNNSLFIVKAVQLNYTTNKNLQR